MREDEFSPRKLQQAVSNLRIQLNGIDFSRTSESRFESVRKKLNSGTALKSDEMYVLVQGILKLNPQESDLLSSVVGKALLTGQEFMNDLANEVVKLFYPDKVVDLAAQTGLFKMGDRVPVDLRQFNGTNYREFFAELVAKAKAVTFIAAGARLGVSRAGINMLVESLYSHDRVISVLDSETPSLINAFASMGFPQSEMLFEIDRLAGVFIQKDSRWSSKLLSPDKSVGFIVQWIEKSRLPILSKHSSLHKIVSEYKNLVDSLRDLDSKVPERGAFWRDKLFQADRVVPRRFNGRDLVGVAMYFGDYVIVEFGPVGNAACVYQRKVFETSVLSEASWQKRDLVDKTINLPGSRAGHLHHVSGWVTTANTLVKRLVGRSRV